MPEENRKLPVKSRSTRSIAWSINGVFAARLFFIFIFMDILLFHRELIHALIQLFKDTETSGLDPLIAAAKENIIVLVFQLVALAMSLFFGTGGIRQRLRPINELASAASAISSQPNAFDDMRFRDLESAIENISPTREDARLHTGNKEMAGLESAVNHLIERMRDSYRQQARFVSDASHELRTPIAVIQGYANMLDRWGKEDEKVLTESIDAIKSESEHMKHLVEQLLFLARGDSGHIPFTITDIDLGKMIEEVCEQSRMIDENHSYELGQDEAVFARGDPEMLKQTARILVENASKYSAGGGTISLRAHYINGAPAFTVQDDGIGMSQSDVPHVFERFYRADTSRARSSGGTGLGLAIAKWVIDRHGGWFEITSREGLGTRISVCLPERGRDPAAAQELAAQ